MGTRDVFTVIRCQRHDCPVYTTCECAFPQRRRNYANDSIFANKLENFLENPRDEGIIIKESYLQKDSRYTPGSCDLRAGIFYHHDALFLREDPKNEFGPFSTSNNNS